MGDAYAFSRIAWVVHVCTRQFCGTFNTKGGRKVAIVGVVVVNSLFEGRYKLKAWRCRHCYFFIRETGGKKCRLAILAVSEYQYQVYLLL
jgi:hypothetical protein